MVVKALNVRSGLLGPIWDCYPNTAKLGTTTSADDESKAAQLIKILTNFGDNRSRHRNVTNKMETASEQYGSEPQIIIVTQHTALKQLLIERYPNLVNEKTPTFSRVTPEQVAGRRVVGVLPLDLSCLASSVITIPLRRQAHHHQRELTYDELKQIAGDPQEYTVIHRGGFRRRIGT